MGTFEANLGPNPLKGEIKAEVLDPNGVAPIHIIRMNTDWKLKVDWTLEGSIFGMLAGKWVVTAVVEGMGNIFEDVVATIDTIDIATGGVATANGRKYTHTFNIQANFPNLQAGVYKLVTVITSKDAAGNPGAFAAFEEGPMLQFYP